jgi:hypothetical protein
MNTFYNTTNISGSDLQSEVINAKTQQNKITAFFKSNPDSLFTPFEVLQSTKLSCINSVRRAITNLTDVGLLIKTDIKKTGDFGKKNYCWKLKTSNA